MSYWLGLNNIVTIYKQKKAVSVVSMSFFRTHPQVAGSCCLLGSTSVEMARQKNILASKYWAICLDDSRREVGNWKSQAVLFHPSEAQTLITAMKNVCGPLMTQSCPVCAT